MRPTPGLFPKKAKHTFIYSQTFTLAAPLPNLNTIHVFITNGLFMPELAGGHQPRFFDQAMTMYRRYRVIGSKISVNIHSTPPDSTNQSLSWLQVGTDPALGPSFNAIIEQPRIKSAMITSTSLPNAGQILEMGWSPRTVEGIKQGLEEEEYSGDVANNPAKLEYFTVGNYGMHGALGKTLYCECRIEYTTIMYKRILVAQS